MALENEVTRVAGGAKGALKSLIKKLGGTVGDELIDKYSGLADKVTKPDKWDKGVLLDGGALKDVNGNDIHTDVKAALDIPAANDAKLTIQKNGAEVGTFSANASADKTVNITVPTKASDIGAATATDLQSTQSAVDTLSGKVGAVPAGKTVVKMIEDAQAAATYDDTAVKAEIKQNADAIGVLNGSGAGSVDKKITDAFNDFATKVSDDGVVNSYKELIDWAATHGAEAATMAGEITTLKNILSGIGGTGESATVVAYVTSAIEALKIGDYAKAADLTALAKRVTAAEGSISTLTGDDKTAGSVKKALADAKAYADGLAPNYDKAGDATKALTDAKSYTDAQIKAIPTPDVSGQISTHNKDTAAHQDIRIELGKKEAAGAAAAVQTNLDAHTGNADIHVTADEKAKWNASGSKPKACLVTLKPADWSADAKTQTVTVASVVADETAQMIHPMPKIGQLTAYNDAGIQLIGQGAGNVTFMCDTIPEADVDVWVVTEDVEDVTPPPPAYLTFSSPSEFSVQVANHGWDGTMEYSTDAQTWSTWDGTSISSAQYASTNVLYIRGSNNTRITGAQGSPFVFDGSDISCSGNIEYLLDYSTTTADRHPTMDSFCCYQMFYNCKNLISAPDLPSTELTGSCYRWMFCGCGIRKAPVLPAMILAGYCYDSMFANCTALVDPPELPATTLDVCCYNHMFIRCDKLAHAPALPAMTLASHCYDSMFRGCTSLVNAPVLPALTVARSCYNEMFRECAKLVNATALPASLLQAACYSGMFMDCVALTSIPQLPAKALAKECYNCMFMGCSNIKLSTIQTGTYTKAYRIPCEGTGTTAADALSGMFKSTGGTFAGVPDINITYYLDASILTV